MPSASISHRRTHNLLLASKLLNLRDSASPLTLILDSLEQPAAPLLKEYIRRAKLSKTHVTYISFDTLKRPDGVDTFIQTRRKKLSEIAKEVVGSYPSPPQATQTPPKRCLVIFDSLHPLVSRKGCETPTNIPMYMSSLLAPMNPHLQICLLAVYHQDVAVQQNFHAYSPSPLSLFTYLATTLITVHSLAHVLAQKAARDRSQIAPLFGLAEETSGIIIGRVDQPKNLAGNVGIVLEMEHRRKSGRSITEWYFLPSSSRYHAQQAKEVVILLQDHPLYQQQEEHGGTQYQESWEPESTFELGLTERQRRERENVVLPYFDAQKGEGPGEGGRILYDMGEEDDFDEEEDDI
ncbi:hypothetical protein VTO42DRAFT_198 [Malbranchea cinnamomea]